jgi:cell division protein FtsI/penicillin-binding protein 2
MAQTATLPNPQQETIRRRLPFVVAVLVLASLVLLVSLASIQFQVGLTPEVVNYLETLRDSGYTRTLRAAAARGNVYDRNGETLATNTLEYQVGVSPDLLDNPRDAATQLSSVLGLPELEVFEKLEQDVPWVLLASRVSAEVGQRIAALDLGSGVQLNPIPRRSYPQGPLASHIIGFVGGDLSGYYGVEGYYQDQLAGAVRTREISNIPFEQADQLALEEENGRDVVLTMDRDVQFLAETELLRAISDTGAEAGTIIVMNPRNGDVLALANYPSYDPNAYFTIEDPGVFNNLAISGNYEPGSVMKLVTVAGALDRGVIQPDFTYIDNGVLEVGGVSVQNWDRRAWGAVDVTGLLVNSLNVGASTVSTMMGPQTFYEELEQFGFGQRTGIDLQGEEAGILFAPGDPDWSEGNLATNAFGQGVLVTPIQMLSAVNAIANGGLMMQPRVVHQIVSGDTVIDSQPAVLGRPISSEAAAEVTQMMVRVVADGLDNAASVPGYTIAGKTGTAEIPTPFGYESNSSIVTFVGFLPADDPQISVLIRLDRPRDYWASLVAAPVFQRLAERLVVALSIPPDDVRRQLAAEGGSISSIQR